MRVHRIEQEDEEFVRILLICAREKRVGFEDCGDKVCGAVGREGVLWGVHGGEDGGDGAVDTGWSGACARLVRVRQIIIPDEGVVDKRLEDRGHVTRIPQILDPSQTGHYLVSTLPR